MLGETVSHSLLFFVYTEISTGLQTRAISVSGCHRITTRTWQAQRFSTRLPSLQLQHVRHRRGNEKATKQCEGGRDQSEGQGVGTNHGGAMSQPLAGKRVKRSFACSDTNEDQRESRNYIWTHLQLHTCHTSHVHIKGAHERCCTWYDVTPEFRVYTWRSTGLKNQSAHVVQWTTFTKFFTFDVTSEEPHQGGYAGVRLGEAQNPKPTEHERESAQEEPSPRPTRIDEAGDAVSGSQDSTTR